MPIGVADPTIDPAVRLDPHTNPALAPSPGASYPYETGVDPTYDAWSAQYGYGKVKGWRDAQFANDKADQDYRAALKAIDDAAGKSRTNLQTNLLQRGVYRSGETSRRGAELEAGVVDSHTTAEVGRTNAHAQVSRDLQDAITSLDLQNQSQINSAIERQTALGLAGAGSSGGGGGSGGSGGGGGGGGSASGGSGGGSAPAAAAAAAPAPDQGPAGDYALYAQQVAAGNAIFGANAPAAVTTGPAGEYAAYAQQVAAGNAIFGANAPAAVTPPAPVPKPYLRPMRGAY